MTDPIKTHLENGILKVRIDRPEKKNALTQDMYGTLARAFARASDEDEIRVVLFTGSTDIFTAGNDLSGFAAMAEDAGEDAPVLQFINAVRECPVPVVASVNGAAIGIGATILLHCDVVIARPDAYLHMPFTDLATVPEGGSSWILPRRFGRQIAAELLILSKKVSAERAHAFGLVTAVEADADSEASQIATRIAAKPPAAMRKTKALMFGADDGLADHITKEMHVFSECIKSAEMQETIARMMQKR